MQGILQLAQSQHLKSGKIAFNAPFPPKTLITLSVVSFLCSLLTKTAALSAP
jgi:hypothetical protein